MFKRLEDRLNSIENSNKVTHPQQQETTTTEDQVSQYDARLLQYQQEIKSLKLKNYQMQCANRMAYCAMENITKKMSKLEISNNRKMITISGLFTYGEKKEDVGKEIQDFFETELDIVIKIDDFFFMGQSSPPLCVVSLTSQQDKREIMANKKKLKDTVNKEDNPIYINDYWSAEGSEKKKVEKELVETNEKLSEQQQMSTSYRASQLFLNGQPWVEAKMVSTPSPLDLIDLELDHLSSILAMKIGRGDEIHEKGSKFIGYTTTPASYQQIQDAYLNIKLAHPEADHVICAYYMTDGQLFSQDYCDDGEHGAGRYLLDYMLENRLKSRAIFIVRYFGGQKLQGLRFECIKRAAISAVAKNSQNSQLKCAQDAVCENPVDIHRPPPSPASPQSRQRRTRTPQTRPKKGYSKSNNYWRRGNHTQGAQRGANRGAPRGAKQGHYTAWSTNTRNKLQQGNSQQQHRTNKRKYDFEADDRRSRYSRYFTNDGQSVNSDPGMRESWSERDMGAF